jgi:DNA-binding CsgD family transcriptional regulator
MIDRFAQSVAPPAAEIERVSARELEVLKLVARAMTNAEIGDEWWWRTGR